MKVLLSNMGGILRLSKKAFECMDLRYNDTINFDGFLDYHRIIPNIYNNVWEGKESIGIRNVKMFERITRTHPKLISCYKELGDDMVYDDMGELRLVDIPKEYGDSWYITSSEMGYEVIALDTN